VVANTKSRQSMLVDFEATAAHCAPYVAVSTLRAIAKVESAGNPYAIGIVKGHLVRQPRTLLEGISTVKALQARNIRFSAGLIQIYQGNWARYSLDHESVFNVCANMRAAQGILSDCYRRATKLGEPEQIALRKAISCYYSNNFVTGYREGYVQKVVAAALSIRAPALNVPVVKSSS
jgi:type IV secretion system protein VirB1